ncbi:hypothetical protein RRG08_033498 [Elysia crispata]|uniref:Protein CUSTOS n=1 Tax=Elysia crispata TaxID=231223 RepID=A0AAE1AU53_9GAST|nr:hypothetical protein RRG08_033498 [Elysia crispata]
MAYSKDDAVTISCSDSSDDEEEQRRISEAVSGVSTSGYQKSDSGSKVLIAGKISSSQQTLKFDLKASFTITRGNVDLTNLKSNRPQDRNEEDDDQLLKTTPEFRAYVAKQLSKLLDRDLSECLVESAWEKSVKSNHKYDGGVKLFSDSKTLLELKSSERKKNETTPEPRKRKIRLSTSSSSDSSEDEDIKACVYSVADIEQENQRLARLEDKSGDGRAGKQNSKSFDLQTSNPDSVWDKNHTNSKKMFCGDLLYFIVYSVRGFNFVAVRDMQGTSLSSSFAHIYQFSNSVGVGQGQS